MRNNRKNTLAGSPPQVRGKLRMSGCRLITVRITPAGAGKTLSAVACLNIGEDHPRRCGENGLQPNAERKPTGSPPQVRGKQVPADYTLKISGITPAGAGKTLRTKCGCISNPGSPPQVRGKRCKKYCRNATFGITPAGAGKTRTVRMLCCGCRDHPRRCGENASSGCPRGMNLGSPPQVRGKPSCCVTFLSFFRITPAGAGKTSIGF